MRTPYDFGHLSHTSGHIGRIQNLSIIPVEAGASMELNLNGVVRLAPNRKEIVSECQLDVLAFFVPHRIPYGQAWIDFINGGIAENETFTGYAVASGYRDPDYLCLQECGATINKALVYGYNSIWYNYYAVPSFPYNADNGVVNNDFTWYPTTETGAANCRAYGRLAARLPHILNGANTVDPSYPISDTTGWESSHLPQEFQEVPVTSGVFTLADLAEVQGNYESAIQGAWFAHFYQDVMREKWGGHASKDADPRNLRPTMLGRQTSMMSGQDIDGTDDATLGTFQGKTVGRVSFHMPRKFFGEHGLIFVQALVRYPLVHNREVHPLLTDTNWTYLKVAADPKLWANQQPEAWNPGDWLAGGSAFTPVSPPEQIQPFGQHYRFQPNRVHKNYLTIPGYPFSNWNSADPKDWYYYMDNEYFPTFQSPQMGQWQINSQFRGTKFSPVPGIMSSIFAGT